MGELLHMLQRAVSSLVDALNFLLFFQVSLKRLVQVRYILLLFNERQSTTLQCNSNCLKGSPRDEVLERHRSSSHQQFSYPTRQECTRLPLAHLIRPLPVNCPDPPHLHSSLIHLRIQLLIRRAYLKTPRY